MESQPARQLRLVHVLLRHALDRQMLFVSSADAPGGGAPIDEAAPLAPRNSCAATKAAANLALEAMAGQGPRPLNHAGPGQSADLVIPAFARQIARIEAWAPACRAWARILAKAVP